MGFFTKLIDRMVGSSVKRMQRSRSEESIATLVSTTERASTHPTRSFTIHEAMNGKFIEFIRHKYNPNSPDEYRREIYLVREDEALIDAISTILVLWEK